jgi:protein O-mannosyl-transferase
VQPEKRWGKPGFVLMLALLVCLTLVTYMKAPTGTFLYADDSTHVYANPYVLSDKFSDIGRFWGEPYKGLYIPVTYSAWALQYKVPHLIFPDRKGPDPRIYHTTNLLVHLGNVLLVFFLLIKLSRDRTASLFGALLFAIHPVQVESVAWVSELKGLLSAGFSLLSILLYAQFITLRQEGNRYGSRLAYLSAFGAFLLALLSKPSAVVLPAILFVISLWLFNRRFRETVLEMAPWLLLAVVIAGYTANAQSSGIIDFIPGWGSRVLLSGDSVTFYLSKVLFPFPLGFDYGRSPEYVLRQSWVWLTGLFPYLLVSALGIWAMKTRKMPLVVPLGIFIIGLLPVLGFKPTSFQSMAGQADRYAYLSMLGPALALTLLLNRKGTRIARIAAGALVLVLMIVSFRQVSYWHNNDIFLSHTKQVNPQSSMYYSCLIEKALEEGNPAEAERMMKARLTVDGSSYSLYLLACLKIAQGKSDEAIPLLNAAIQKNPNVSSYYAFLAEAHMQKKAYGQAKACIAKALALDPESIHGNRLAGRVLYLTGDKEAATGYFLKGLFLQPGDPEAYRNAQLALKLLGDKAKAMDMLEKALRADPENGAVRRLISEEQAQKIN